MPLKKITESSSSSSQLTIELPEIEDNSKELSLQVDILKQISKKLFTLISAVNEIKDGIHDIKDQTISKTVITPLDNNDQQISQTL